MTCTVGSNLTFYHSFENGNTADIAGGLLHSQQYDPLILTDGLFGMAEDSITTPYLSWYDSSGKSVVLSKPGSVSYWAKIGPSATLPGSTFIFDAYAKNNLYVLDQGGWGIGATIYYSDDNQVPRVGAAATSTTSASLANDGRWHLVVLNWSNAEIGVSVDGQPQQIQHIDWLTTNHAYGNTLENAIYLGGVGSAGGARDEVMFLNRPMTDAEIQWYYNAAKGGGPAGTNPAVAYFSGTTTACSPFDDLNSCTADSCNSATGMASDTALLDGTPCSDGNLCNGDEFCFSGFCSASPHPLYPGNDGNSCTTDSCDPLTGTTMHVPLPNGTVCDDGNPSTALSTCIAASCQPAAGAGSGYGQLIDLGIVHAGGVYSEALGVGASGDVTGAEDFGFVGQVRGAWRYSDADNIQPVAFEGAPLEYGVKINASGTVAGYASSLDGSWTTAFTVDKDAVGKPLFPAGVNSYAYDINDAGQVTGVSDSVSSYGFRLSGGPGGTLVPIPPPPGAAYTGVVWGESIGPGGEVSGSAMRQDYSVQFDDGFVYSPGWQLYNAIRYTDAGGTQNLNDYAEANGWQFLTDATTTNGPQAAGQGVIHGVCHAFRYTAGTNQVIDLGTISTPGFESAETCATADAYNLSYMPMAINSSGEIVGYIGLLGVFYYNDVIGMVNLQDFVDPALGVKLAEVNDINDNGEIVGAMYVANHTAMHPFRMKLPVDITNPVTLRMDGIVDLSPAGDESGPFVAVFGHNNAASTVYHPKVNSVSATPTVAGLTTPLPPDDLAPGDHPGSFLARCGLGQTISWNVDGQIKSATATPGMTFLRPTALGPDGSSGFGVVIGTTPVPIDQVLIRFDGIAAFSETDRVAVFSYVNFGDKNLQFRYGAGLTPNTLAINGDTQVNLAPPVPEWFAPGDHPAALVIPWSEGTTSIAWTLGVQTVTATDTGTYLSTGPTADGNGSGPILPSGTPNSRPTYASTIAQSVMASDAVVQPDGTSVTGGETAGGLDVTPDGAARYVIPLSLPPGRGGLTPKLVLEYNSRGGDGPFGVGWRLAGPTAISRCKKTVAQDGAANVSDLTGAIKFDATDAFCLSGKRLIQMSTSGDQIEFKTQEESYSKILATVDSAGPVSFDVYASDGLIHHYSRLGGRTRVFPQRTLPNALPNGVSNRSAPWPPNADGTPNANQNLVTITWPLATTKDRRGNTITYSYQEVPGPLNGVETILTSVSYSDAPGSTSNFQVDLSTVSRTDPSDGYIAGVRFDRMHLYSAIRISSGAGSQTLRQYNLTYSNNSSISGRSLLTAVTECDRNNVCKSPTRFGWNPGSFDFSDTTLVELFGSDNAQVLTYPPILAAMVTGDFNGDGQDDIVYRGDPAKSGVRYSYYLRLGGKWQRTNGDTTYGFGPAALIPNFPEDKHGEDLSISQFTSDLQVTDFDRDGRADIIVADWGGTQNVDDEGDQKQINQSWRYFRSTGDGRFTEVSIVERPDSYADTNEPVQAGDMSGDGLPDIMTASLKIVDTGSDSVGCCIHGWFVRRNSGGALDESGFLFNTSQPGIREDAYTYSTGLMPNYMVDTTGSGRLHALMAPWNWDNAGTGPVKPFRDVEIFNAQAYHSFLEDYPSTTLIPRTDASHSVQYQFIDFNGDGLPDAVATEQPDVTDPNYPSPTPVGDVSLMTSAGTGFLAENYKPLSADRRSQLLQPAYGGNTQVIDWDQDGRQDLLLLDDGFDGRRTSPVVLLAGPTNRYLGYDSLFMVDETTLPMPRPLSLGGKWKTQKLNRVLDANGDGLTDLIQLETDGYFHLHIRTGGHADQITSVTSGLGARSDITYDPLVSGSAHYTPPSSGQCPFPLSCVTKGPSAVSEIVVDKGMTTQRSTRFDYREGYSDLNGLGWLGLRIKVAKEQETGIQTETVNGLDMYDRPMYPLANRAIAVTTVIPHTAGENSHFTTSTTYGYEMIDQGNGRYIVRLKTRDQTDGEAAPDGLSGTTVRTISETFGYDTNGAVNRHEIASGDGVDMVAATTAMEPDDVANWIIQRPHRIETTNTDSEGNTTQSTVELDHDSMGDVSDEIVEPDEAANPQSSLYLKTHYDRSRHGAISRITRTDAKSEQRVTTYNLTPDELFAWEIVDPEGHHTQQAVNPGYGVQVLSVDPNGVTTSRQVDGFGRVKEESLTGASSKTWGYFPSVPGMTTTYSVTGGPTGRTVTDAHGRVTSSVRSDNAGYDVLVDSVYDAIGPNWLKVTMPHHAGEDRGYDLTMFDNFGRVSTSQKAGNASGLANTYYGLQSTIEDDNGATTVVTVDQLGRVAKSASVKLDGTQVATQYTYGASSQGPITKVVLPGEGPETQRTLTIQYDRLGRKLSVSDPDSGTSINQLNGFGDVIARTDGNGKTETTVRDHLGRPLVVTRDEATDTISWDTAENGLGKVATLTSTSPDNRVLTSETFGYDAVSGRVSDIGYSIGGAAYGIRIKYDSRGRIDWLRYPSAVGAPLTVQYYYNEYTGAIRSVLDYDSPADPSRLFWNVTEWGRDGEPTVVQLGNGVSEIGSYDQHGRILSIDAAGQQGVVQSMSFDYDPAGNTKSRTDNVINSVERFSYDALNRLEYWDYAAPSGTWRIRYPYDDAGNLDGRTVETGLGDSLTFHYGETGHGSAGPHAITTSDFGAYYYDQAGQQTAAPGRANVTYRMDGLPLSIAAGAGGAINFQYDAVGQRVRMSGPGNQGVDYVGAIYEHHDAGAGEKYIVYAGDRRVAELSLVSGSTSIRYLHTDSLGSVAVVTDAQGSVIPGERRAYDPFGRQFDYLTSPLNTVSSTSSTQSGYIDEVMDADTGLVDLHARQYDPTVGRFISPDPLVASPLNGQSFNHYSYALNNPLTFVDHTGLSEEPGPELPPPPPPPSVDPVPPPSVDVSMDGTGFSYTYHGDVDVTITYDAPAAPVTSLDGSLADPAAVPSSPVGIDSARPGVQGPTQSPAGKTWAGADVGYVSSNRVFAQGLPLSTYDRPGHEGETVRMVQDHPELVGIAAASAFGSIGAMWMLDVWLLDASIAASSGVAAGTGAVAIPTLAIGPQGQMFGQAMGYLRDAAANMRVDMFRNFAQQIEGASRGAWYAAEMAAVNGTVFLGSAGEALVFNASGQMFRGGWSSGAFNFTASGGLSIAYELLREAQ